MTAFTPEQEARIREIVAETMSSRAAKPIPTCDAATSGASPATPLAGVVFDPPVIAARDYFDKALGNVLTDGPINPEEAHLG